jgi:hypothetical protein
MVGYASLAKLLSQISEAPPPRRRGRPRKSEVKSRQNGVSFGALTV